MEEWRGEREGERAASIDFDNAEQISQEAAISKAV